MKEYITGIGGVFFRSQDKDKAQEWYTRHFGLQMDPWGGKQFMWLHANEPSKEGSTVWSPFARDTDYFGNSGQEFMINYRVRDLDELLGVLAEQGIHTVKKTEEYDYGKFAWVEDCDGRRIELWEPKQ